MHSFVHRGIVPKNSFCGFNYLDGDIGKATLDLLLISGLLLEFQDQERTSYASFGRQD